MRTLICLYFAKLTLSDILIIISTFVVAKYFAEHSSQSEHIKNMLHNTKS